MSDFNAIQQDATLEPFFSANPGFDLETLKTFNFFDESAVSDLNWTDLDPEEILDRLKGCQRLLHFGLDGEDVINLCNQNLDSGLAIASLSETGFMGVNIFDDPEQNIFDDPELAKSVHRQARAKTAGLMVVLANVIQFSSQRHANASFDSAGQIRNSLAAIPSYQELFGSLDYLQCEHCQSIFSPAAYFVDLMRMVEEYIVETDDNLSLKGRRPDLKNILLTCDNTNDTVPYTQIVSDVLEEKLKPEPNLTLKEGFEGFDVFKHLATALYPRNLPFNLYLEQIRIYLGHLETNLADIYQTFSPQEPDSISWEPEYLGLSPEEYKLITTLKTDDLADRYGVEGSQGDDFWGLNDKETFLKQTKLSWQELDDLLYQNLSSAEIADSTANQFYINADDNYLDISDDGQLENLSLEALDRIDRFLRLAKKLGWSFADLDWVLASIVSGGTKNIDETAIKQIAQIKQLQVQTKLPLDVLCSFWHEMKTIGKGDKPELPQDLFDRIFNNPFTVQGQRSLDPTEDVNWKINCTDDSNSLLRKRLLAALQLKDEELIALVQGIWTTEETIPLNLTNLSRLFRNALLLHLLELKVDEYQLLLGFLDKSLDSLNPIKIQELTKILEFVQWLKVSGFTIYELDYILDGTEYPSVEVFLPKEKMADSMESLWKQVQLPEGDLSPEQKNELNEKIANHFGIDPGLFSILAELGADLVGETDYIKLLLTKVETEGCKLDKIVGCLKYISRIYLLVSKLPLTTTEFTSIKTNPQAYNVEPLKDINIQKVRSLYKFKKQLVGSFGQPEENLLAYLAKPSVDDLAKLTGWESAEIKAVMGYLEDCNLYNSVEGVLKLKQCFDLALALGCRVYFLWHLCDWKDWTASDNWDNYKNKANSVANLVKAKYGDEQWTQVFGELNGALEERKCQILSEFALWKLNKENLRQLSEYLLLDVEMTSCACNSKIQLGILSVQTYLQRCRMGIEPEVTEVNIPPVWWEWIMNYRVWEANRKVFLYPENYIDPALRQDASPIFKELQDELLQSEITADAVEEAYHNYFNKLAELAKLQIVDGGTFCVPTPNNYQPVKTLFLLAKTQTQPHTFYYRTCEYPPNTDNSEDSNNKLRWGYWQKIDLQINSEYLAPVYAFNRLFIFWVETKEITNSTDDGSGNKEKIPQATIKYSFQNSSQKWAAPQDLFKDRAIAEQFGLDSNFWQQVYPVFKKIDQEPVIEVLWGGLSGISSEQFNQKLSLAIPHLDPLTNIASDLLPTNLPPTALEKSNVEVSPLPQPLSNFAATIVGNGAIFAGGIYYNSAQDYTVALQHDSSSNEAISFIQKMPLSEGRYNLAATTVGNLAIFAGGYNSDGNNYSDVVDVFRSSNGKIEKVNNSSIKLSQGRTDLAATTLGNPPVAIFAGGHYDSEYCQEVDVFQCDNNGNLEQVDYELESLSIARAYLAATTVGNRAIFAGGISDGNNYSDVIDVFRCDSNGNIEKVTLDDDDNIKLSEGRAYLAATTVEDLAIFAGGENGDGYSDAVDVFRYDSNGNLEKVFNNIKLSKPRAFLAATTVGNLAIFAGGYNSDGYKDDVDVFRYDSNGNLEKVPDDDIKLSEGRAFLAATTVGNLAIFAGGKNGADDDNCDVVDVFSIASDITVNNLPSSLPLPCNTTVTPIKSQSDGFILQHRSEFVSAQSNGVSLSNATRLTTSAIQQFNQTLLAEGLDGLLSLESQQISEGEDFSGLDLDTKLDFDGAYGAYFWEIFFHIPFLIASTLNTHQSYDEARKWYQYIFDPTSPSPDNIEGLVGYWPMNEGSGTNIFDKKGNNHGTIQGGLTWKTVNDFPGTSSRNVLVFDGNTDNYIEIQNPFNNSQEFTISLWVKPSINDNGYHGFIGKQDGDASSRMPSLGMTMINNNLRLDGHSIDKDHQQNVGFNFSDFYTSSMNGWVHISWIKDGNQHRVYRNTQLFDTEEAPDEVDNVDDPSTYYIGKVDNSWTGEIAEVRIWERALSDKEIADLSYRFWQFLPFRGNELEKLKDILTNKAAIEAYKDNPFDPHAIARLRIGAYEKAVVMKYIDNLLDWADSLFTQDTWEYITQATTLYLLAYDLLGPKPENVGKLPTREPVSFANILEKYGNAGSIPDFLIDLENYLDHDLLKNSSIDGPFNAINAYFCVSENKEFAQYWERVEDRLFKIRHCQNIKGIERQLALFGPPIDPNQLVRLAAAGDGSISLATTDNVPNYRFSYLLERAKGMTSTVIQLGGNILSTLEKKDAEKLAMLRATHEPILLQLITKTKQKQIEEAEDNLTSLQKSLDAAKGRAQHYQNLIAAGWNAWEKGSVGLMGTALGIQVLASVIREASTGGYLAPCIFGTSDGGMKFGDAIKVGAEVLDYTAGKLNQSASIASTTAQFQRRAEDWQFQQQMAEWDAEQIEVQIEAAKVRIDLAKAELDVHNKSIQQSQEIEQFFKDKFTNKDLYQWMLGRLSSLYFQTYTIALKMAYAAQTAYQYELAKDDDDYIQPIPWDSNKKGLLAGESLMLELNQLEKAYLDGNERRLEIEKIISLRQLDEDAFNTLKTSKTCQFSFKEEQFEADFPNHSCRQIKTISVSIPAVVGPYQNLNAMLTQTQNTVNTQTGAKRRDLRQNQKIAISKGVNDNGLFVLNFQDDRYLPFEGTGAISCWELKLSEMTPQTIIDSITDVIITLSYTALYSAS